MAKLFLLIFIDIFLECIGPFFMNKAKMESRNCDTDGASKMDDYEVMEQIGRGAFGAVFAVLHKSENKKYVLKKISLARQTEKFKHTALQEMNLIVKLSHPYIVEYKDAWVDKGSSICIVTNYCEGGNMEEIIRRSRGVLFSEEKLRKWLTQLLLALDYLHSHRVLFRDLKLSNIFITKDNDIRLGDFGLAKLLDAEVLASSVVSTPNYMCPELLSGLPYCYKTDIWSLGCCVFEMTAHQPPFKAPDMTGLINKINRGVLSLLPIIYSSTLKQIIKSMLRKSPQHRPTAAELLRHQYLQPYLLRSCDPSSVFLPVKSPNDVKGKRKPSPGKSGNHKYSRDRQLRLKEKGPVLYVNESDNIQPRNLSDNYETFKTKLETNKVDPTRTSAKISQESEDSKTRFFNESTSSITHVSKLYTETELRCYAAATENVGECREAAIDCMTAERNGLLQHQFQLKKKASTPVNDTKQTDKDTLQALDDKVSLLKALSALAALAGDEHKGDWEDPCQQRAEALKSLLELCSQLLKQDKINELAGVLKPFGDDAVSSRETAILLTKSLASVQKLAKEF